ncbi:hypothetical protein [Actinomadura sp. WMMB 499]|uniref:hypothetical protein n=1 Tax=Actinomadura sp. WMMB 499 TaxID=1219491 RepID=UPI0012480105|nr:hypothetical protein [Actinomadura sp. WMMB 499]QFG22685.1 hypothetical protein F7P10_17735 [Actinomadura sp. WMMB 499]
MKQRKILGLVAAAVLCVTALPAPAQAARTAPVIEVEAGDGGFTAPATHTSGPTSFRVSSTATGDLGSMIGLVRLHPGTSPASFTDHLGKVFSGDPEVAVPAGNALMDEAELLGGAQSHPGRTTTFTARLRPGTYYLLDYLDFEDGTPPGPEALHELTVQRERHRGHAPRPGAFVGMSRTPSGPRFHVPSEIRAGAPILLTNHMRQVNEAIFVPVRPGTTRADMQEFWDAAESGEWIEPPFAGDPVGTPPLSHGRTVVLQAPLEPGRYALITWVFDLTDGVRLGAKGMHTLVTVK